MNNLSRRLFIKSSLLATAGITLTNGVWAAGSIDYTYYTLQQISELIRTKKVSPVEITKACLKRIALLNPKLNAFITITSEQALREAKIAEIEIKKGKWKGPLHGIPVALKDNIDTAGISTTAASKVFKNRIPAEDADVVKQLKKAGAIIIGKTNMHEFALGTTSHISYYGAVHNPWNTAFIPGGSSGGSAVAVATGMCYAAIGTDTGGSNRLPAACCGVVGFKPSFGLISTNGIIPAVQSLDHAGVFARSVEDAAIVLNDIAEKYPSHCGLNLKLSPVATQLRIGVVTNYKASDEVKSAFDTAITNFKKKGFKISSAVMPGLPEKTDFMDAELKAYHDPLLLKYDADYQPEMAKWIKNLPILDNTVYLEQKAAMEKHRSEISGKLFKDVDVLVLPTTTSAPVTIEEAKVKGAFALDDANTFPMNYFGLPAISIPCGFTATGLPLGLQIVGPRWGEQIVLDVAYMYQQSTKWHLHHPNIKFTGAV